LGGILLFIVAGLLQAWILAFGLWTFSRSVSF